MSDQSTNLQLPFLAQGQAQKHVTVNESLLRLDALVQLAVVSATTTAQPASPSDGELYIMPSGKTGAAWGAMANEALAYYVDGAWQEIAPREGWLAFVRDTNQFRNYDGAAWAAAYVAMGAAADSAVVHLTGAQTIAGVKTFTSTMIGRAAFANIALASSSASNARGFRFALSGATSDTIYFQSTVDNYATANVVATINAATGIMDFATGVPTVLGAPAYYAAAHALPAADNTYNLGAGGQRFGTVYAATGTINTSDAGEKTPLQQVPQAVKRAVRRIISGVGVFQRLDAVEAKGAESARLHIGVTAQAVRDAFAAEGEDAERWALFCRDVDADGRERLGLRHDQLFALALSALAEAR
jgi:hypothetical protein